jgi:LmbE family N-acetylglucosaminyl deacetylase
MWATPPYPLALDILAIAAHRDDVEQTCGGTLLKMAQLGHRTGILDLTKGEMGTRGSAEDRAREALDAAKILCVSWRHALDIPDGRVENTWENRLKVAGIIRQTTPRVLILPYWKGRHPDHYTASILGYEACFLAGLAKLDVNGAKEGTRHDSTRATTRTEEAGHDFNPAVAPSHAGGQDVRRAVTPTNAGGHDFSRAANPVHQKGVLSPEVLPPHRPFKIIYATLYYDTRPTFVVDITDQFEARFDSLMAYKTQFSDQEAGKGIFPAQAEIRARVEAMARYYGMLAGVTYGEPFLQKEVGLVEDLTQIPVKSI